MTENISVWKKCSGQALFKRPNLRPGQLSKPGQEFLEPILGPNWAQATRPMGPRQFRSRFIVCQRSTRAIIQECTCTYAVVRLSFPLQNPRYRLTVLSSARTTILQGQNCKLHSAGGRGGGGA